MIHNIVTKAFQRSSETVLLTPMVETTRPCRFSTSGTAATEGNERREVQEPDSRRVYAGKARPIFEEGGVDFTHMVRGVTQPFGQKKEVKHHSEFPGEGAKKGLLQGLHVERQAPAAEANSIDILGSLRRPVGDAEGGADPAGSSVLRPPERRKRSL